jgi:hypothetical protein
MYRNDPAFQQKGCGFKKFAAAQPRSWFSDFAWSASSVASTQAPRPAPFALSAAAR